MLKTVIGRIAPQGRALFQAQKNTCVTSRIIRFSSAPDAENADNDKVDDSLQKEMEELRKEAADWKDRYTRALAENENVRRRNKKLLDDSKIYAIQSFAKDLLEVADILQKAKESVSDEVKKSNEHLDTLHEGVIMTEVQLQNVFKSHGLVKLDPIDEKFDPNYHEALFHQPVPGKESGTVASVQKTGYRLHERPLRPALVSVVK